MMHFIACELAESVRWERTMLLLLQVRGRY